MEEQSFRGFTFTKIQWGGTKKKRYRNSSDGSIILSLPFGVLSYFFWLNLRDGIIKSKFIG